MIKKYPQRPAGHRGIFSKRLLGNDTLLDLGSLTNAVADVIELRAAYNTVTDDLYTADGGAVVGEGTLNADAVAHTTDGEGLADTAALHLDDDAFEVLKTLAGTLDDLYVNTNGVTDLKLGQIRAELLLFEFLNDVCHFIDPFI